MQKMPWLWIPAGALIALSVLSINFIGDGLRDALDPRSRER
jgi:peptide/nickel transport system permease protein